MNNSFNLEQFKARDEDTFRVIKIEEHSFRDKFQRDRDRILYSKEFRRLSGKTQIFVTGFDDNMRNRLTHTLEVAQIADTISRELGLNTNLTMAIAYGHDVGHTPFGHVGERTLNYIMNGCFDYYGYNRDLLKTQKGFKHNLQGVRVTSYLEGQDDDAGLNLTMYTLWGIQNHTSREYKGCEYRKNQKTCRYKNCNKDCKESLLVGFYDSPQAYGPKLVLNDRRDWTFEAIVVAYADEIAQRHHDIEDGIYAKVINPIELCKYIIKIERFTKIHGKIDELLADINNEKIHNSIVIQRLSSIMVDFYATEYINAIREKTEHLCNVLKINAGDAEWKSKFFDYIMREGLFVTNYFCFDKEMVNADKKFGRYLQNHILYTELAQSMDGKASFVIRQLVKAYLTNPQQLPGRTITLIVSDWLKQMGVKPDYDENSITTESYSREKLRELINDGDSKFIVILLRRICDYIAGMTDRYALECYEKLYGSKGY